MRSAGGGCRLSCAKVAPVQTGPSLLGRRTPEENHRRIRDCPGDRDRDAAAGGRTGRGSGCGCHSKVAKNPGPQCAANAKGTFRVKWCVNTKKRVPNVRPSLDVDIATVGNARGYDVVGTRVANTKGGAFKKNQRKKCYTLHTSYKDQGLRPDRGAPLRRLDVQVVVQDHEQGEDCPEVRLMSTRR